MLKEKKVIEFNRGVRTSASRVQEGVHGEVLSLVRLAYVNGSHEYFVFDPGCDETKERSFPSRQTFSIYIYGP